MVVITSSMPESNQRRLEKSPNKKSLTLTVLIVLGLNLTNLTESTHSIQSNVLCALRLRQAIKTNS